MTELMLDYLHSSGLNIGFEDLQMSPHGVIKKYQTLVSHLNVQKKHVIKVEMRDSDGSMMIRLSNLRVIILLRVIDEIIYFFDYISDASKQLNTELCSQSSIIGALENFRRERKRMIKGLEKTRQPTGDTDRNSDLQRPAHPDADKTNQPSKTYFELQDIELLFPQTSNSESYFRGHVTAGSAVICRTSLTISFG